MEVWMNKYRGYGEPLMGFWPYLRQAHKSEELSPAGTWHTTFFTWLFLLFINLTHKVSKTREREREGLYLLLEREGCFGATGSDEEDEGVLFFSCCSCFWGGRWGLRKKGLQSSSSS